MLAHAAQMDVLAGKISSWERFGNRRADHCAVKTAGRYAIDELLTRQLDDMDEECALILQRCVEVDMDILVTFPQEMAGAR